ncbi:MAG: Gfo/Idh/MocA family oxidoreductase [Armatimonadetes bacterium]|nr:Gfo/Idh/MocA family oxidoreductase [Armatimonadota bacterium]
MAEEINVGLIGYKFMGKAHSQGFRDVAFYFPDVKPRPRMKVICGRDEKGVTEAQKQFGWDEYETNWRNLVQRSDIGLVDIATGNNVHHEMAIAAAEAGKHIFCEKPLAMNVAQAREMVNAVKKAGVINMVNFNYRAVPAIRFAKQLIDEGKIGRIFHWRGFYLQDWIIDPDFPLVWRLQGDVAGSGAHGDLAAHSIDLAHYLVGDIDEVVGHQETFVKERPKLAATTGGLTAAGSSEKGEVTVDDASLFLVKFKNGAVGTFEATRFAAGHRNGNTFEINGDKGSIRFNVERLNELEYFDRSDPGDRQGFRVIQTTEGSHPWMHAWWPPAHIIGWAQTFTHQVYELMTGIATRKNPHADFEDGLKCQIVLEAVTRSSRERRWVSTSEI